MVQIWATKYNWAESEDMPKKHKIVQTIGPFSISACGIVAPTDIYYGWAEFRQYSSIMKEPNICGKCLAESELKQIDRSKNGTS